MRMNQFLVSALFLALPLLGCKAYPGGSSEQSAGQSQYQQSSQYTPQDIFPTPADVQDFYEIMKSATLKNISGNYTGGTSSYRSEMLSKFSVRADSSKEVLDFYETMFELLESGRYSVRLKGVSVRPRVTRTEPKGLTSLDLANFLQMVKTEYYLRLTKQPIQTYDVRETGFYARAKGSLPGTLPEQGDLLTVAADMFDKIEGVK